jgi:signal peptide peptidase SppA
VLKKIFSYKKNSTVIADTVSGVEHNNSQSKFEQLLSVLPFSIVRSKPVVAVLRLEGIIGKIGSSAIKSFITFSTLNSLIEKAFKIDKLSAFCLSINSPGGSPVQAELIANRIISLAKASNVPVYSFIEDVAASGGYWLACSGDKIYASQSSIVGSIGVVSSGFGFHDAISKLGIERRLYTQGKTKSVLDPFQPVKESDINLIQKIQKDVHEHFIDMVKLRRRGKLTQTDNILFNGEFWTGRTAVDYGLIDGISDLHSFIQEKFGDNVRIDYVEHKQSWFKKKLGVDYISDSIGNYLVDSLLCSINQKLIHSRFEFK